MTAHNCGIRQVVRGSPVAPGKWQAVCDTCMYVGPEHKDPTTAQGDAIGHQGGTLRVREKRRPRKLDPAKQMDEMFPGAR